MRNDPKNYAIVEVIWKDAADFEGLAESMKDLPSRVSVGYMVRNDKKVVGVCTCLDLQTLSEVEVKDMSEGHLIPRQWIENINIIREVPSGSAI